MRDLPEGWAEASLQSLVGPSGVFSDGDWVESKDQDPRGEVRLIQLADIGDGVFRDRSRRFLTSQKARELGCTFLEPGDVLVARMPDPLGRACIFPGGARPAVTAVDVCIVRPGPLGVDPRWLAHAVNSPQFRRSMEEFERGTTRKRISRRNLGGLSTYVPPLVEQSRIVTRVEALLHSVSAVRGRLARAGVILKRFRRSVLAAACSGRLTEDWREEHADVETAAEFLTHVPSGQGRVRRGLDSRKANRLEASEELRSEILPATWATCSLGSLFSVQTGTTPSRKRPQFYQGGTIPWVKTSEVQNCEIASTEESVTELALAETSLKLLPVGTILIAMYGEGRTRGQVGRLRIEATTNQACAALVNPALPPATVDYVFLCCRSLYDELRDVSVGGNQPNLNLGRIRAFRISVPPLAEQSEVVRRADALFRLANSIEARVGAARTRVEKLTQSILAKAFRGELVSTEAQLARREGRNYEPASALLARIGIAGDPPAQGRPTCSTSSESHQNNDAE